MTLQCPHCGEAAMHQRRSVLGHFVICPRCNRHFEWERVQPYESEAVWAGDDDDGTTSNDGVQGNVVE